MGMLQCSHTRSAPVSSRRLGGFLLVWVFFAELGLPTFVQAFAQTAFPNGEYVRDWLVLGPLPPETFNREDVTTLIGGPGAIPREQEGATGAEPGSPQWKRHASRESVVNFEETMPGARGAWALAYTGVESPGVVQACFHVGTGNAYALWVNGVKVTEAGPSDRFRPERSHLRAPLHAGTNHCLMAVRQSPPYWGFQLRIDGEKTTPPPPVAWHRLMDIDQVAFPKQSLAKRPWKWKVGDDPVWASPDLDDADWSPVPPEGVPIAALNGDSERSSAMETVIWFRLHEEIAEDRIGDLQVFDLGQDLTCEVFLDGVRICGYGEWGPWFEDIFERPVSFVFRRPRSLVALRYRCSLSREGETVKPPPINIENYAFRVYRLARHASLHEQRVALLSILAVLFVFLLARYMGYRKRKDSLMLAVTALLGILALLSLHLSEVVSSWRLHGHLYWTYFALTAATSLSGLMVLTIGWRGAKSGRSLWVFGIAGIIFYGLAWLLDNKNVIFVFSGLVAVEYVRVYLCRIHGKRQGAWIMGAAIACYLAGLAVNLVSEASGHMYVLYTPFNAYAGWYGFCALLVLLSAHFALDSARTATNLDALRDNMQEAMERQQRRIGQDIHDGLIQHLSGLHFMARVLARRLKGKALDEEAEQAGEIAELISQAATQARGLSHGLCPVELETEGVAGGLHTLAAYVEQSSAVACTVHCDPEPAAFLDAPLETAIHVYRIAQEAVNNALKHAAPSRIDITLMQESARNLLLITDDGRGLDTFPGPESQGLGIRSMRYRAEVIGGTLTLERGPSGGTCVTCTWPRKRR